MTKKIDEEYLCERIQKLTLVASKKGLELDEFELIGVEDAVAKVGFQRDTHNLVLVKKGNQVFMKVKRIKRSRKKMRGEGNLKVLVNFRLPSDLVDKLDEWSKEFSITRTRIVESALSTYFSTTK